MMMLSGVDFFWRHSITPVEKQQRKGNLNHNREMNRMWRHSASISLTMSWKKKVAKDFVTPFEIPKRRIKCSKMQMNRFEWLLLLCCATSFPSELNLVDFYLMNCSVNSPRLATQRSTRLIWKFWAEHCHPIMRIISGILILMVLNRRIYVFCVLIVSTSMIRD